MCVGWDVLYAEMNGPMRNRMKVNISFLPKLYSVIECNSLAITYPEITINFFFCEYLPFGQVLFSWNKTEICKKWRNIDVNIKKVIMLHFWFVLLKRNVSMRQDFNFWKIHQYHSHHQALKKNQCIWDLFNIRDNCTAVFVR